MKEFFNLQSIKNNLFFYICYCVMLILIPFTPFKIFLVFNLSALILSLFVWCLSSLLDKKTYFNIGTFITVIIFGYGVSTFMFELLKMN